MKKRILSAFMVLALCLTLLPAPAWAAEPDVSETPDAAVVAHTHNIDTDGKCTECGAAFGASVTARVGGASDVSYYDTIDSAFTAAHEGDTVTLLADITSRDGSIFVSGGPYTLDLNGHRIDASGRDLVVGDMDASEALLRGELTVKDSSTDSAGYVQYLKLWNGDLTVESGNFHQIIETGSGSVGTITITGGTAEDVTHTSPNVTFQLSGGTFDWISISSTCGENVFPSDLLADGYAYANKNSGAIQNGYAEDFSSVSDVKVVKHDHTWNDGTCACGYTCSHTAVDENGNCTVCKKPMAAMVTKGGESRAYAALNDALSAADDGGTVKLLANAGEITISRPLKLDLNGKTAAKLTVTGDVTLASLLPEGYTFKSGSTWITDPSGKELTNVSMAKLPIKSMNYPTELSMTYGGTGTLLVTVTKETGAGVVRFQWYKVEDGKETAVGSATTSNRFDLAAQNLSAGRHTFRFSGTCDGYKKMSEDIAVTVQKASIGANRITPPTAQENLTYTGQVQALITAGSVTDYGTMQYSLTENGTYSQDIPVGTDAGTYTVWYRVIGDANHNDTAPASVAVSIGKKPLTITKVACADKIYDGTTTVKPTSVIFDNVTLNRGTDYNVTASFDDASVGSGKNITATVTLMEQTAKNYALEQSSFMTTGSITKAAVPDFTKETALVIVNGHEKTYTVTLPTLPTLETPKEYGALTYEISGIKLDGRYYTSGAKVENGKLTLPIQKNDVKTTGSVGTVTVVIKSTNYEDITLTVRVDAVNKKVPALDGELSFSKATLIYGEQLDNIKISGTMKDGNNGVTGSFAWQKPSEILAAGTHQATWIFTPTDTDAYAATTGTAAVKVGKATPTGTPIYEKITASDKTLADAKLNAIDAESKSVFSASGTKVPGTIKWVDKNGNDLTNDLANIKVVQGESYKWIFTPTDHNYKELAGTIVLWAKPVSGGGGGGAAPAPTPSDADVVTIKGDNKDNTNAKPGAENGTTITKTTVKNTTTETTKNEQGQDVSKTTASVSKDLGDKLLDQAVSNKSDTIEITVKSSDANNGSGAGSTGAADSVKATEVELPKATVNAIAKDTNADLVIKTDNGEVVLDNKTLETIAGAAKGDTVTIVVGENTQLKETQKPAEKIVGKNGTLFDLVAKIGEKHLHQFEGGKAYVILPMPQKLKGKDILVIYIDDNGLCKILNHSVVKIGAEDYIRFTTTHFSTFAVVDKDEAERLIKEQNAAHVKELMQSAKFKVTTTKTSKKSVKVQVAAKSSKSLISDIKSLGYTVKYQFYRSTKKDAGYKLLKTSSKNSFISTKGTKGRKYYYKARVLVYDGSELIAGSALKQCSYGARTTRRNEQREEDE